MGPSSWQGQLRAAPNSDLVTALRVAHDEAQDAVLRPTPQEEQEELRRTMKRRGDSRDRLDHRRGGGASGGGGPGSNGGHGGDAVVTVGMTAPTNAA